MNPIERITESSIAIDSQSDDVACDTNIRGRGIQNVNPVGVVP